MSGHWDSLPREQFGCVRVDLYWDSYLMGNDICFGNTWWMIMVAWCRDLFVADGQSLSHVKNLIFIHISYSIIQVWHPVQVWRRFYVSLAVASMFTCHWWLILWLILTYSWAWLWKGPWKDLEQETWPMVMNIEHREACKTPMEPLKHIQCPWQLMIFYQSNSLSMLQPHCLAFLNCEVHKRCRSGSWNLTLAEPRCQLYLKHNFPDLPWINFLSSEMRFC